LANRAPSNCWARATCCSSLPAGRSCASTGLSFRRGGGAVADHWRAQGAQYVDSVTEEPEEGSFGFDDLDATASDNPEERKYRRPATSCSKSQKASTSWLQRQMGVGYNTAAKWIERMESDGLSAPPTMWAAAKIYRDKDGNALITPWS
jgi:S-DNA-T family DNA segregation ATPase FtsK/SpoIIIE